MGVMVKNKMARFLRTTVYIRNSLHTTELPLWFSKASKRFPGVVLFQARCISSYPTSSVSQKHWRDRLHISYTQTI